MLHLLPAKWSARRLPGEAMSRRYQQRDKLAARSHRRAAATSKAQTWNPADSSGSRAYR